MDDPTPTRDQLQQLLALVLELLAQDVVGTPGSTSPSASTTHVDDVELTDGSGGTNEVQPIAQSSDVLDDTNPDHFHARRRRS